MTALGAQVSELDGIQKTKDGLDNWVHSQENVVAEMLKRPAKFRQDASQLEINLVSDMRQSILEKQAVLDDIEARQASIGAPADHQSKIALDTLDEHVSSTFRQILGFQLQLGTFCIWLEYSTPVNLKELLKNMEKQETNLIAVANLLYYSSRPGTIAKKTEQLTVVEHFTM